MTLPPDDTPEHEPQPPSAVAKDERRSDATSAGAVPASATSAASTVPSLPGADRLRPLVEEIKARLAELAEREAELQRREDEIAERKRQLEQYAQEVAHRETQQQRQSLELRGRELDRRAAELDERRRRLDEFEQSLAEQQRRLDQQRATIEQTLTKLEQRKVADGQRHGEIRRRLTASLDLIRQRKREFIEKAQLAREELKSGQLALGRDRKALNEQLAALDERRQDLERRAADLEQRVQEVEARAQAFERRGVELETAAAELDEREKTLTTQEAELAGRRSQLDAKETELHRRTSELDTRAQEVQQRAETLQTQQEELERWHQELESTESQLQGRDRDLQAWAQQLESGKQELEARVAQCNAEAEALRSRAAELERLRAQLEQSQAELDERFAELGAGHVQLEEFTRGLEQREKQLGARQEELQARQEELDQSRRLVSETGAALARRREEIDARGGELDKRQAALAERARRLDEREAALNEQARSVESRCEELARREAEIEERRASVDKLHHQAVESQQCAQRQRQEVAALQERLEAREVELRCDGLQVEIDREQIRRDYAALTVEHKKLAKLRAQAQRELDRLRAATEQRGEPLPSTRVAPLIPAASLRRRGLVLSGMAAFAVACIWFAVEQPRYRGFAEVRIASAHALAERILDEHVDWLMSDAIAQHWQSPPPVEDWIAACAEQRVWADPLPESGALRIALDTADKTLAETLLPAAAKSYAAYVDSLPAERFLSRGLSGWSEQKNALENESVGLRNRCQEIRAQLAEAPAASAWNEAQATFEQALVEFKHVGARLREQRAELVALRSRELPRGEVTSEAYQQALADDPLYQEDLKEFGSEARQHQTELAVSMVLLVDSLRELRKSVEALAAAMVEQRDLQPPPNVRVLLEQCLAEVDDFNRFLAEFSQTWGLRRETIERLKVPEQVTELVDQQRVAAEATQRLVAEARRVSSELKTRVDALTNKDSSGTRELVVAAVLRGNLSQLFARLTAVEEAAGATDTAVNFRLDAHSRQLAGLRARLRNRQQGIRELLQAQADRAARAAHDGQERQLRESIGALDQQRQELMDTLVAQLERLRDLDEQNQDLRGLNAELRRDEAALARCEARLIELEAQQPEPQRDRVELADAGYEQVAGVRRLRNATLVGVATFVATALLLLLMFLRWPRGTSDVPELLAD